MVRGAGMRGRGMDFEHRFKTSRWAEDLLISALNSTLGLITVRFGLSVVRPESELIYGNSILKEPDLLIFKLADLSGEQARLLESEDLEGADRRRFETGSDLSFVFRKAVAAIEVEFSPYKAREMKDRDWQPRSLDAWNRRPLKHANAPTAPNVIVKEEDLPRLTAWEQHTGVPIIVVHLFDQEAFAVLLNTLCNFNDAYEAGSSSEQIKLQVTTGIFKTLQSYDRVDAQGAGEKKWIFRVPPCAAFKVGDLADVKVKAQLGTSTSQKYVSHIIFEEGQLKVSPQFLEFLATYRT